MKNNWIPIEYKEFYLDFPKTGLKVQFLDEEINNLLRQNIMAFCRWLRKKFWFPMRCKIIFEYNSCYMDEDKRNKAIAIFYPAENDKKNEYMRIYLSIRMAVANFDKKFKSYGEKIAVGDYYLTLAHELTHYYQWYFLETNKRTLRSLEIEANRCAYYIVEEFLKVNKK